MLEPPVPLLPAPEPGEPPSSSVDSEDDRPLDVLDEPPLLPAELDPPEALPPVEADPPDEPVPPGLRVVLPPGKVPLVVPLLPPGLLAPVLVPGETLPLVELPPELALPPLVVVPLPLAEPLLLAAEPELPAPEVPLAPLLGVLPPAPLCWPPAVVLAACVRRPTFALALSRAVPAAAPISLRTSCSICRLSSSSDAARRCTSAAPSGASCSRNMSYAILPITPSTMPKINPNIGLPP